MTSQQKGLRRVWAHGMARKMGLALIALLGVLSFAALAGPLGTPGNTVFAGTDARGNEPWLEMNCPAVYVEEGDDFRLHVVKKHPSDSPIRVYWYTEPITADESDYKPLHAERQVSNGYQTQQGVMGRDFGTKEDMYSELDETFRVRFDNSVEHGHDGESIITIRDDDGVGIYDLEITSVPDVIWSAPNGEGSVRAYIPGDVIEITARFTGDVTNVNPATGEQSDYAGIHIQVGEDRRVARLLRGAGTDTLVFGYTVRENDLDADGVSVEYGGSGFGVSLFGHFKGFRYNGETLDIGLWPVCDDHEAVNRFYRGLGDDPRHLVAPRGLEAPTFEEPTITPVEPTPDEPVEGAVSISVGLIGTTDGELTAEDGGRDWYSFDATGGENYIIELKNMLEFVEETDGLTWLGGRLNYVEGHLVDPSILEVLDDEGEQVLGEHDQGGFMGNFARAFFVPDEDGTYYIAVGAGAQDRGGTGFYTLSVRVDDYPDDYGASPGGVIRPGGSLTAVIDSDVSPDHPGLNQWDWAVSDGEGVPVFGVESLDDRDVLNFEISEEGTYRLSVTDGPAGVGIWTVLTDNNGVHEYNESGPVGSVVCDLGPGSYQVEIGTPYQSAGNVGSYTVSLEKIADDGNVGAT